jgi:dynein heavy chain
LRRYNRVKKNSSVIEKVVEEISTTNVIAEPPGGSDVLDIQEMFEFVETQRKEHVEELVRKYRTIAPLLGKVEEAVAGTNTGRSPQLKGYYAHWEKAIFLALNDLVLNGLDSFVKMLHRRSPRKMEKLGASAGDGPLFKVLVLLNSPEIVVQPPLKEVTKHLVNLSRNLVDCASPFVRWMDGTCLEAPEQKLNDDDEPFIFNFYRDVAENASVIKVMLTLNHTIQKSVSGVNRYVESWNKHSFIWKQDKDSILQKFVERAPTCEEFEEKLSKYTKMANDIWEGSKDRDVDFVRINARSLGSSLKEECLAWVTAIGKEMDKLDAERVVQIRGGLTEKHKGLHIVCEDINDLKSVLNIVATVRGGHMQMELDYLDIEERYRTRQLFDIPMDKDYVNDAYTIRDQWDALKIEAEKVDDSLGEIREKFTEITMVQVTEFAETCKTMLEKLRAEGPGLPTVVLDEGVVSLKEFQEELAANSKMREELVNAERWGLYKLSSVEPIA